MKKLIVLLSFLLASCSVYTPFYDFSRNSDFKVERLQNATVALVYTNEENYIDSYCSGVFISDVAILTAAHCVSRKDLFEFGPFVIESESEESPVGDTVHVSFFVDLNERGLSSYRDFRVTKYDRTKDLALLYAIDEEKVRRVRHSYLRVSERRRFTSGERVYVMGNPSGVLWTFTEGMISRDRIQIQTPMPTELTWNLYIHATADVYFGNSGGPLVDESGELIGIDSLIASEQSHLGFFVHPEVIDEFLFGEQ